MRRRGQAVACAALWAGGLSILLTASSAQAITLEPGISAVGTKVLSQASVGDQIKYWTGQEVAYGSGNFKTFTDLYYPSPNDLAVFPAGLCPGPGLCRPTQPTPVFPPEFATAGGISWGVGNWMLAVAEGDHYYQSSGNGVVPVFSAGATTTTSVREKLTFLGQLGGPTDVTLYVHLDGFAQRGAARYGALYADPCSQNRSCAEPSASINVAVDAANNAPSGPARSGDSFSGSLNNRSPFGPSPLTQLVPDWNTPADQPGVPITVTITPEYREVDLNFRLIASAGGDGSRAYLSSWVTMAPLPAGLSVSCASSDRTCVYESRHLVIEENFDAGGLLAPQDIGAGTAVRQIKGALGDGDTLDAYRFQFGGGQLLLAGRWDDPAITEKLDLGLFDATGTQLIGAASAEGLIIIDDLAAGAYVVAAATDASFDPAYTVSIMASVPEPSSAVLAGLGGVVVLLVRRVRHGGAARQPA